MTQGISKTYLTFNTVHQAITGIALGKYFLYDIKLKKV